MVRFLATLAALGATVVAHAHPYHVTVSEATVDRDEQRLEVAMKIFPEDLEAALSRRYERKIDIEQTEDIDALLTEYLRATFTLRDPEYAGEDGDEAVLDPRFALRWVGKEIETRDVWLYFTIALEREIEGLELSVTSMFEVQASQENVVVLSDGDRRVTLRCEREAPKVVVEFTPPEEGESDG